MLGEIILWQSANWSESRRRQWLVACSEHVSSLRISQIFPGSSTVQSWINTLLSGVTEPSCNVKSLTWFWSHTPRRVSRRKRKSLNTVSNKTNIEKTGTGQMEPTSQPGPLNECQGEEEWTIFLIAIIYGGMGLVSPFLITGGIGYATEYRLYHRGYHRINSPR